MKEQKNQAEAPAIPRIPEGQNYSSAGSQAHPNDLWWGDMSARRRGGCFQEMGPDQMDKYSLKN